MDKRNLDGKVAVVTGGASGIGLSTVETLIEYGAKVVVGDIQAEKGSALETRFGPETLRFLQTDVTNEDQLQSLINLSETAFGGLDILFNNAGHGGAPGNIEELAWDDYDQTMDLLLKAVFMGTQMAIPLMKKRGGGSIINTSSVSAISAGYAPLTYSVAKIGVAHFSRIAAGQLAKYKIRVNSIRPGFIATSIFGASMGLPRAVADQMAEQLSQAGAKMQPIGRTGEGRDIAEMVAFLASDAAGFVTGESITVDGGITTGPPHSWNEEMGGPLLEALGITPEQVEAMMAASAES
ncbi:SDR family NAD(P)-dependent oxidoreductase [Ponticaulis profundi]|uniref:SDR family NAD(P)-dependent oxidoreductase n=1 Tax=Ponticaulis profundi TaxID=2665222 RepID=A0ABW1S9C9_9PROT